jgi:hypothetical protein
MIIVNLKGGLGNQMFQYALGRKLALKNNNELKLDVSGYARAEYSKDTLREYKLANFNIEAEIATAREVKRLKYPYGLLSKLARAWRAKILKQHHVGFEPSILKKKGDVYLDGYWQSATYFADIADTIRQDFSLKQPLETSHGDIVKKIVSGPSISLHVRRGDYVSNATNQAYWETCSPAYYEKALAILGEKIGSFTTYVFSDDPDWVKNNIDIPAPVHYVSGQELADYQELFLMSKCNHHIIANSSFSWWGAWLNPKKDKIVIAPKKWTAVNPEQHKDIAPTDWIRL